MLVLKDVRQYIASLDIAEDENVYIGKMDSKKQKSIGVYSRKREGSPNIALGGLDCTTYNEKSISLLIHWSKSQPESEEAAHKLYEKLLHETGIKIGDIHIQFLRLMVPEPIDIGTDDNGIYEYVIWLDLIYERKGD